MDISIVQWAADECYRQLSGELSVAHLCEAWLWLSNQTNKQFDSDFVMTLGMLVDPVSNGNGFRTLPVHFANGQVVSAANIQRQVDNLCEYSTVMTPIQFYTMFEKIHPFYDGNGRVGSLLYNYLSDTLNEPIAPPDVFANNSPPCI